MRWSNTRPTIPGYYWFKGSLRKTVHEQTIVLATVVDLIRRSDRTFEVWFPHREAPVLLIHCDGRWAGPLYPPRG